VSEGQSDGAGFAEEPAPLYTVARANQLLPALIPALRSLQDQLTVAGDRAALEQLRTAEGHNGGGSAASAMLQAGERVERELGFLREHGILLRDPATGLVDFPARREGQPVFLCWRMGEPAVQYWHRRDQGFVDRQPL
jgi:hypothetical protein